MSDKEVNISNKMIKNMTENQYEEIQEQPGLAEFLRDAIGIYAKTKD